MFFLQLQSSFDGEKGRRIDCEKHVYFESEERKCRENSTELRNQEKFLTEER
jgi:hypothetical protein